MSHHFGRVSALTDVNLSIYPGEVVGLVGDNGAGKSTFVKILSGALAPSRGELYVAGERVEMRSPVDARRLGIETVYQDLALALHLSVAANVFLGREEVVGRGSRLGWLDDRKMEKRAAEELAALGINIPSVTARCDSLSGGQRQAVAVARAVAWGTRLVLMDEPTAALGVAEQEQVGRLTQRIRDTGTPVLLVSHNLPQVHQLCDRIIVFLHGRVATVVPRGTTIEELVMWITGAGVARPRATREDSRDNVHG